MLEICTDVWTMSMLRQLLKIDLTRNVSSMSMKMICCVITFIKTTEIETTILEYLVFALKNTAAKASRRDNCFGN